MTTPKTTIKVGDRFKVLPSSAAPRELRGKGDELIARYLPGYGYKVTPRNEELAILMLAKGEIEIESAASEPAGPTPKGIEAKAGAAKVSGQATTGKSRRK